MWTKFERLRNHNSNQRSHLPPLTCTHDWPLPSRAPTSEDDWPDELTTTKLHPICRDIHGLNPSHQQTHNQHHSFPHIHPKKIKLNRSSRKWQSPICSVEHLAFYLPVARAMYFCNPDKLYKGVLEACNREMQTAYAGLFWEENRFEREIVRDLYGDKKQTKGGIIIQWVSDQSDCISAREALLSLLMHCYIMNYILLS